MASQNSKTNPKKPKLVRDSFTIPKTEFAAIDKLKTRAIALGTSVKKSELLRAGLMALQGLSDGAYKTALAAVPALKTGRPTTSGTKPVAKAAKATTKPAAPVATQPAAKTLPARVAKPTAPKAAAKTAPATKVVAKPATARRRAVPARKTA